MPGHQFIFLDVMPTFTKTILFRCDQSDIIGTGHVMRCITIADEAKRRGWQTCFALRDPDFYAIDFIKSAGHQTEMFKTIHSNRVKKPKHFNYEDWLPVSQDLDAIETLGVVSKLRPNWVVVDHYGLDATWHELVRDRCEKIAAIDDLGDRKLSCDIVLDQNLGASAEKYENKVSENCRLLLGPRFALLRNEFKGWREKSLRDRFERKVGKILITMGGADPMNYTLRLLKELSKSKNAKNCEFVVIVGALYPHFDTLNDFISFSYLKVSVLSNVTNMAEIMSSCDLCIGAAGSTSWERCCLGLPTIALAVAENQKEILNQLQKYGVVIASNLQNVCLDFDCIFGSNQDSELNRLSKNSSSICDGEGVTRVLDHLEQSNV